MPQKMTFYEATNLIKDKTNAHYKFSVKPKIYDLPVANMEVMSYTEHRDFENFMFPIRILTLILTPEDYFNILQKITPDKPFIPVTINIDCTLIETVGDTETTVEVSYMQGEYMGLPEKTKVDPEIIKKQRNNDSHDEGLDQAYVLRISLWDLDDLQFAKSGVVSGNLGIQTPESLIRYAFSVCKGDKKCVLALAPPDNKTAAKGVIVRALGFLDFLRFIDKEYGVYTSNYNVFVENGVVYVLNTEKNDTGMNAAASKGQLDDKIVIHVYPNVDVPINFYGVELVENHYRYILLKNNLIEDDLAIDNIMRPVDMTVNSDGKLVKSGVSTNPLETISPVIKVDGGRSRGITKANKNPKFAASIKIDDLPIHVEPYTIVRYVADNRVGDCMVRSFTQVFTKESCSTDLRIKSYDEFMEYEVKEKQVGKNLDKK